MEVSRICFAFDEIDKFAEMYLSGIKKREQITSYMWQLRDFISTTKKVGFIFAGSHTAKAIFVEDSKSPFYNSITSTELARFSIETDEDENSSRQIVQPGELTHLFEIPKDVLEHLLWITGGIPYYMKLVAASTYVSSKQKYILSSDINRGLMNLLKKTTGIVGLDGIECPGEDELRTISTENEIDAILVKGVLFAAARISDPIEKHHFPISKLWSLDSPLIKNAKLPKISIQKGFDLAESMRYLRFKEGSESEIEFTIPILGASLRNRFGTLWARLSMKFDKITEGNIS